VTEVAVDDAHVYWFAYADDPGKTAVLSASKCPGAPASLIVPTEGSSAPPPSYYPAGLLATDPHLLFFVNGNGFLIRVPK
jgi:hypothetical protein